VKPSLSHASSRTGSLHATPARLAAVLVALFGLVAATHAGQPAGGTLDLADPRERLEAYIRAHGDTAGGETFWYAQGTVFGHVPGERPRPLFGLEVVGVSRFEPIEGGWLRLHREVGYYTDLATGQILERWHNPFTDRTVDVLHIQNDPVNRRFTVENTNIGVMEAGDEVIFYREVPLRYPNPLPRAEFPRYSSGDFYEALEMFNTFARRSDLEDRSRTAVPSVGSWARQGPWLPWMEMGRYDGHLIYHSRSVSRGGDPEVIPARLREHMKQHHPKYLSAPEQFTSPDETSWTFFRKHIEEQRKRDSR
jgi:hypothetical protein